uniref:Ionotropic receptor n=1 Tax=Anoplophora chinensis TaxID=217632 RepID=A0A2H4ZBF7_ANOCN|nr:ionotropic receptor [Anoplophora chinensis]
MGYWTKNEGFSDNGFEKNTARRRQDLKGTKLNTCLVITQKNSLYHLIDKRDKHIDSISKVNYVLVEHLKDIINATFNYSVQQTWGYKNKKSEWSGMIGELTRNEADIGGTALFFTIDRINIIDYIAMATPTRSKFVFRQPKLSYVSNVYTLPFDYHVWLCTIFLVIIVGIFLYITVKWEWQKSKHDKMEDTSYPDLRDSISDVAVLSFGALCQQGAAAIPVCVSGRITTIIMFISLMFLYTSYSANIVALLQSSSNSIKTLEDLLHSRLQIGVDDTVFNRFYFPNATEATRRAIYLQGLPTG